MTIDSFIPIKLVIHGEITGYNKEFPEFVYDGFYEWAERNRCIFKGFVSQPSDIVTVIKGEVHTTKKTEDQNIMDSFKKWYEGNKWEFKGSSFTIT